MARKFYDVALLTGIESDTGNAAEVWVKITGDRLSTDWLLFGDQGASSAVRLLSSGVDLASFEFADIGEPHTCEVELRGSNAGSWHLESVELIDGDRSYLWEFGTRLSVSGGVAARDNPVCDVALPQDGSGQTRFAAAFAATRLVIQDAADKWRARDANAPEPEQVLHSILLILDDARLLRPGGKPST